jgi:ABC-type polysaccharide/polyol phosphate export permease
MSAVRSIAASLWLGIYRDLAWTSPVTVLALRTIAPVASAMTVSIIFYLGSAASGSLDTGRLSYVLVGAVLYAHISAYAYAPTLAIAEGKNLGIFAHVYIAPSSSAAYLAGRTLASFVISLCSSMLALAVAYFVLGAVLRASIPLVVTPVSLCLLFLALLVVVPASLGLGYLLGAYSLFASKFEWALPTYISGLLMVFSGALFPTSILPWPFSAGANALPYTQFIAAARDAIVYGQLSAYWTALLLSVLGGTAFLLVGLALFSLSERKARRDGVIDRRLA